jgi:hypothetical protein
MRSAIPINFEKPVPSIKRLAFFMTETVRSALLLCQHTIRRGVRELCCALCVPTHSGTQQQQQHPSRCITPAMHATRLRHCTMLYTTQLATVDWSCRRRDTPYWRVTRLLLLLQQVFSKSLVVQLVAAGGIKSRCGTQHAE